MAQREATVIPEATPEQAAAAAAGRPATAEDAQEATRKEYGQWVASQPIYIGTALGYNPGDAVGAAVVEERKWSEAGLVVKRGSKAHNDLRVAQGLPPLEN